MGSMSDMSHHKMVEQGMCGLRSLGGWMGGWIPHRDPSLGSKLPLTGHSALLIYSSSSFSYQLLPAKTTGLRGLLCL